MKGRASSRLLLALAMGLGPALAIGACGGDDTAIGAQDDASTDDVAVEPLDASLDAVSLDAAKADADARAVDASVVDAAKVLNSCGGYARLELGGLPATPGRSCGSCGDGTIACVGSDTVACEGASHPPCPVPPVDAGPNACGGYGPLKFMGADASLGDSCGECGQVQCASATSLACVSSGGGCYTDAGLQSTCMISTSDFTATPPSPTLPAETPPSSTTTSAIALSAADLAFNPYDGFLYASLNPGVSQGNSVAKIDPATATVIDTVYVGPSPTHIAISDDGQALWVVLSGSTSIRRVDLTTFTAGSPIAMRTSGTIASIQVIAGTEDSVALTSSASYPYSYGESLFIFDNGVPRPYGAATQVYGSAILPTASAALLFAMPASYSYGAVGVCVDANGAFLRSSVGTSVSLGVATFDRGVFYNGTGNVYDAQSGTLLHTFPVPTSSLVLVALDANDVYFLTSSSQSGGFFWIQVTGFDRSTHAATPSELLQTSVNGYMYSAFTRWGRYGFAYLNGSTSIEIARSTIIPDMP